MAAPMNEDIEELLHRESIQLATIQKRSVAFFIDEVLLSVILMIVLWDSFTQATTTTEIIALTNAFVFEYMAMKIVYQTFFIYQYGATLGKLAMKIYVMDVKTLTTPVITVALNRAIFRIISEMLFYLGFLWGILTPERQTWHDKTARTLVVSGE
jgi:uncharacterized RDD family membrane protein YckC